MITIRHLKMMLIRVESKEDLSSFKAGIKDDPMNIEDNPEHKMMSIKMHLNNKELTDDMVLNEISSTTSENLVFKFSILVENNISQYQSDDLLNFQNFIETCGVVGVDSKNPTYLCLKYIKIMHDLANYPGSLDHLHIKSLVSSSSSFISPKLNLAVFKHFQEPLSLSRRSSLPLWIRELPKHSWYLFSYATRVKILENYRFTRNESFKTYKQKVKVDRNNIVEGAMMIMGDISLIQQGTLEIQYEDEVGIGIGPTMEFFSLLSQHIRELNVWRKSVILFPSPHQHSLTTYSALLVELQEKR